MTIHKLLVSLVVLVVAISACSPTAAPTPTPEPTETQTPTEAFTDTPAATQTPFIIVVTASPTRTPTAERPAPTLTNCTPRADWTTQYTVVVGDTLGRLAQRTGSTVSQLAQGNCLSDPNRIVVGQRLRLPRVPATNTPTATLTATLTVTASATAAGTTTETLTATGDAATFTATGEATSAATETATSTATQGATEAATETPAATPTS